MSDIQTLMRSANPVPDAKHEFTDGDVKALLTLTMTRSGEMDVKENMTPVEPDRKFKGWFVAAAAFTVVMIVGVVAVLSQQSDSVPPATSPTPTTTTVVEDTPTTTVEAAPTTTVAPATATTAAPATAVPRRLYSFETFADGTFTVSELGVPVTFTVTGDWHTQPIQRGFFVITTPDSERAGDHDIIGIAPTQLFDAATGELLPDGDDLAGWLESVPATATISDVTVGEIGGFETKVFTVDPGDELVHFSFVDGEFDKRFNGGFIFEVHWVDHPDGPIAFVIGTPTDDLAWLDTARNVLETIEFG